MQFTVHYNDDRAHSETVVANTREMAAWKFVQAHPRPQPVQLTVVVSSVESRHFGEAVVWWSSAFEDQPAPDDEAVPELKLIATGGREPGYDICGTPESLKRLAMQLLAALDRPSEADGSGKSIYSITVRQEGGKHETSLGFFTDPKRKGDSLACRLPLRIILLLLLVFAVFGLFTAVRCVL